MNIDDILNDILRREGGFVDYPNDKGGPTKYGITLKTLRNYYNSSLVVHSEITRTHVMSIDRETAKAIYLKNYFVGPNIDQLPKLIQPIMLDTAILFGPSQAIKFLQEINNKLRHKQLEVDGVLGPKTRIITNTNVELLEQEFINTLITFRILYHYNRVFKDESQKVFLQGWINRAREFLNG